jgi:predicted metal-binding protein
MIQIQPVIDYSMRALCAKPYPLHAKGCPNLYKSSRCPPKVPHFDKAFDMTQPIYAVVNEFDFGAHVDKMRAKHPDWSDRQLRCVLYWQSTARKQLKVKIVETLKKFPGYAVTMSPEGQGVNVTETMRNAGVILEWPPQKIARQIAFLAKPRRLE